MMKPEFTKAFDAAAAARGAPFCCNNGWRAEVLKYSEKGLFGTITNAKGQEFPAAWTQAGESDSGVISKDKDLAMLPLGRIEDKPVFVGDRLLDGKGEPFVVQPGQVFGPGCLCKWAPPAKVYPQFEGSLDMLAVAFQAEHNFAKGLLAVASATIRHAVDAGQVVPKDEHEAALCRLGEQLKGVTLDDRTARDMAVASAVRDELVASVARYSTGCSQYISSGFDFAAIIATIK